MIFCALLRSFREKELMNRGRCNRVRVGRTGTGLMRRVGSGRVVVISARHVGNADRDNIEAAVAPVAVANPRFDLPFIGISSPDRKISRLRVVYRFLVHSYR